MSDEDEKGIFGIPHGILNDADEIPAYLAGIVTAAVLFVGVAVSGLRG